MKQGSDSTKQKRSRSEQSRHQSRQKALTQGEQRLEAIEAAVRTAMATIEAEFAANDGIYPHNKGALSLNEVARRAGIHSTTLHGKKYVVFHGEVSNWLKGIKAGNVTGRMRVRKDAVQRVAEWRELYEGLLKSHRLTELDLQEAQRLLEEKQVELSEMAKENDRLNAALRTATANRVVSLRTKKGD